jgi:hypothetical protein
MTELNFGRFPWPDLGVDRVVTGGMHLISDELDRGGDAIRFMINTALAPWGGSQVCIDAYETAVRAASDVHLNVARVVQVEPVRSFAASCANLTRDIGATQVSAARWFLDS